MPAARFRSILSSALIFPAAMAAGIAGTAGPAFAASCDKCPERSVTLYDFEVEAPRPDSLADLPDWYSLYFAASGAASTLFQPQCARIIDGSYYRDSSGVPSNSLKVGIDQPNTAPSGNLKGMDYLVSGTVSPAGAGYELTMALECACNRKTVVTASTRFARPDEASAAGAELARGKFAPIADIIRGYEREARDGDPNVSIGGYEAELVVDPARRKAALNEKVPVTLTLIDCDGEPLAGRKISLTGGGNKLAPPSTNGAFTESEATTGSDGKVTVDFVVGNTRGVALARAYFFHKTPFGCEAVAVDETAIEVDGSAAYYQVRYKYEETKAIATKYEETIASTLFQSTLETVSRHTVFSGSAVFKNISGPLGGSLIELEGAGLEGGLMNGSYQETIHFTGRQTSSAANYSMLESSFSHRNTVGEPTRSGSDAPDFYVYLDPEDLGESSQFNFTIPFARNGTKSGWGFQVITTSAGVFDTTNSFDEAFADTTSFGPEVKNKRYSSKDSSFHIDGLLDTSWVTNVGMERKKTDLRATFAATVTPIAVRPKPDAVLPIPARGRERIRILNGGGLIACGLQGIDPGTRVHVGLYSMRGALLATLHDAPRGGNRDIVLSLDRGRRTAGTDLSIVVFRAGSLRESRVLVR